MTTANAPTKADYPWLDHTARSRIGAIRQRIAYLETKVRGEPHHTYHAHELSALKWAVGMATAEPLPVDAMVVDAELENIISAVAVGCPGAKEPSWLADCCVLPNWRDVCNRLSAQRYSGTAEEQIREAAQDVATHTLASELHANDYPTDVAEVRITWRTP